MNSIHLSPNIRRNRSLLSPVFSLPIQPTSIHPSIHPSIHLRFSFHCPNRICPSREQFIPRDGRLPLRAYRFRAGCPRNSFKRVSRAAAPAGRRLKGGRRAGPELRRAAKLARRFTRRRQSELVKPRRQMGKKSFQKGGGRGVRGGKRVTPPVLRDNFSLEATIVRPRDTGDEGEREREYRYSRLKDPRGHGERVIKRVAGEKYFPTRFRPALNEIEDPTSRCTTPPFSSFILFLFFYFFFFLL